MTDEINALERFNTFIKLTLDQDDRSLVLSMTAFLDDALNRLLSAFLIEDKITKKNFNTNSALSTLDVKIKLAYALGLLTIEQYKDLDAVRRIRNRFAHDWKECILSDPKILILTEGLIKNRPHPMQIDNCKNKFQFSMAWLLIEIEMILDNIKKNNHKIKPKAFNFAFNFNLEKTNI